MLFVAVGSASAQLPPPPSGKSADALPRPRLFAPERLHEIGTVIEGDTATVSWTLENHGDAPLVIEHIRATCGCTVIQLDESDKTIPPGESLALEAAFDSTNRPGYQRKAVTVYSNDTAEPTLKLELAANVQYLYQIRPPNMVNLGAVRRGQASERMIEIYPGPGRKKVEVQNVEVEGNAFVTFDVEPFDVDGATGQRITVSVAEREAIGRLQANAHIKLSVDGIERERVLALRGEVVGAVTWLPRVIDATRVPSPPGKQLAPVTIRATNDVPFTITGADAGPMFDVTVHPPGDRPQAQFRVLLTLREDSPPGPFGTTLTIDTNLLDQPVVEVPVFGIVAPAVEVDPPRILLRADGTPLGRKRRVKLQALPQMTLEVERVRSAHPAVSVDVNRQASAGYRHLRFLDVVLTQDLSPGTHHTVVTVTTSLAGAEKLEIPVTMDVP